MPQFNDEFFGNPVIHPDAFVSSRAILIGDVIVGPGVIIAPGARLRADECGPFYVGEDSNVQEGVIIHGLLNKFVRILDKRFSVWIGPRCSVTHGAIAHGPTEIQEGTFVGFYAIVHKSKIGRFCTIGFRATLQNATVGDNCVIQTGAIIEDVKIPAGRYVPHSMVVIDQDVADLLPEVTPEITKKAREFAEEVVQLNNELVPIYKARREARKKQLGLRWLFHEFWRVIREWHELYHQ